MDRVRGADGRDLVVRVLAPAVLVWALTLGVGFAIIGPLAGPLDREDALNQSVVGSRGGVWDAISSVCSYLGSTEMVAAVCLLVGIVVLWRTRDWRLAAVPAIAIGLELVIYLGVTALIHRARPSVERMENLLPMSSYPSGHTGASVALYLSFILLAARISGTALRRLIIAVCVLVPLLVGFGRFYRGMHHLSDLIVGALVGVACALLAYGWYRRRTARSSAPADPSQALTAPGSPSTSHRRAPRRRSADP